MTTDNLIVVGAAGITGIFAVAIMLLYCVYLFLAGVADAFSAGNYGSVLLLVSLLIVAGLVYGAIGLWLQKTGRI